MNYDSGIIKVIMPLKIYRKGKDIKTDLQVTTHDFLIYKDNEEIKLLENKNN